MKGSTKVLLSVLTALVACIAVLLWSIKSNMLAPHELSLERAFNAKLHYLLILNVSDDLNGIHAQNPSLLPLCTRYFLDMREELPYCTFPNTYRDGILRDLSPLIEKIANVERKYEWESDEGGWQETAVEEARLFMAALRNYSEPPLIKRILSGTDEFTAEIALPDGSRKKVFIGDIDGEFEKALNAKDDTR